MKVAINKRYKYLTFEENCPKGQIFEEWVMQERFETHSIIEVSGQVDINKLRFNQFDYNEETNTFSFNNDKYNEFVEELNKPEPPSEAERLKALEQAMLEIVLGGM